MRSYSLNGHEQYRQYRRDLGTAIQTIEPDGSTNTQYVHRDNLGSIDVLTTGAGAVSEKFSYDAFGRRRGPKDWSIDSPKLFNGVSGATANATLRGFTNHEHIAAGPNPAIGLIHMNGRTYDPQTGRFMQADPFIPNPGLGQSYNRYSYVRNNPLTLTDPSGFNEIGNDGFDAGCSPLHANLCRSIGSLPTELIRDTFAPLNRPIQHLPGPVIDTNNALDEIFGDLTVGAATLFDSTALANAGTENVVGEYIGPRLVLSAPGSVHAARDEVLSRLQEMRYNLEGLVQFGSIKVKEAKLAIRRFAESGAAASLVPFGESIHLALQGDFRGAFVSAGTDLVVVGASVVTGGVVVLVGSRIVKGVRAAKAARSVGPKIGSEGGDGARKAFSNKVKDQARAESNDTCVFCRTKTTREPGPIRSEIDHAIPKSRGGNNTLENAQNTCRTCNRQKGAKTTEEFFDQQ